VNSRRWKPLSLFQSVINISSSDSDEGELKEDAPRKSGRRRKRKTDE